MSIVSGMRGLDRLPGCKAVSAQLQKYSSVEAPGDQVWLCRIRMVLSPLFYNRHKTGILLSKRYKTPAAAPNSCRQSPFDIPVTRRLFYHAVLQIYCRFYPGIFCLRYSFNPFRLSKADGFMRARHWVLLPRTHMRSRLLRGECCAQNSGLLLVKLTPRLVNQCIPTI